MTNILVTGGAGNVGGALVRRLVKNPDYQVTVVDNLSTGARWKLPEDANETFRFIKADVNRLEEISAVMTSSRFDYVFHYAAVVGVARTLSRPIDVLSDIDGIRNILELSKNTGVNRVFFSSSSEVYGEPVEIPQNEETTPLNSRLPYAIVKNLGEAYFRAYHQEHGLNYTIFRFFNTFGPLQSDDFVITKFIRQALTGKPITIYGDGSQTRTFCYIDDNIEATVAAFEKGRYINDVVNIGSSAEITIKELGETVIRFLDSGSELKFLPPLEEGDMKRRCPDNSKMLELLGREPLPLEIGLKKTAEFLRRSDESLK